MHGPLFEILAHEPTSLGMLTLRRRELLSKPGTVVTEMVLDHELLMSSHVTESERMLARRALDMHGGRRLKVLVGGLGLGYTVREVLKSDRVAAVEAVEYLPQVIKWLEGDLIPLAGELKDDGRLRVVCGDVYARLASAPMPEQTWDLIIIDVDHSPDEPLGSTSSNFYTEAGLRRTREHLAPGGVLAVWSYARTSPFAEALGRVFPGVKVEPVTVYNEVAGEEQTDWLFLAGGNAAGR